MKSYDLFDLFAAWFTWMAKPRRFLTGMLQEAGWELENRLREKKQEQTEVYRMHDVCRTQNFVQNGEM